MGGKRGRRGLWTTFEEKGKPKRIRTEVPLLTSLTHYAGPNRLTRARGSRDTTLSSTDTPYKWEETLVACCLPPTTTTPLLQRHAPHSPSPREQWEGRRGGSGPGPGHMTTCRSPPLLLVTLSTGGLKGEGKGGSYGGGQHQRKEGRIRRGGGWRVWGGGGLKRDWN